MSLEVKSVVEAFTAKCAQIAFQVGMAFCMAIQKSLQMEFLKMSKYKEYKASAYLSTNSAAQNSRL
jgi:NADH dehydrogenase FAD-containing subunit